MPSLIKRSLAVALLMLVSSAAVGTPLVSGNGFGFAVVNDNTGIVTTFYAHPYAYERADPSQPLGGASRPAILSAR